MGNTTNNSTPITVSQENQTKLVKAYEKLDGFYQSELAYIMTSKSNPKPFIYRLDERTETRKTALLEWVIDGKDVVNFQNSLSVGRAKIYEDAQAKDEQGNFTGSQALTLDGNSETILETLADDGGLGEVIDSITAEQLRKIPGIQETIDRVAKIYNKLEARKVKEFNGRETATLKQAKQLLKSLID